MPTAIEHLCPLPYCEGKCGLDTQMPMEVQLPLKTVKPSVPDTVVSVKASDPDPLPDALPDPLPDPLSPLPDSFPDWSASRYISQRKTEA